MTFIPKCCPSTDKVYHALAKQNHCDGIDPDIHMLIKTGKVREIQTKQNVISMNKLTDTGALIVVCQM